MDKFDHQSGAYFNNRDAKIYYQTIGDKSKPVLLLLHGGFGTMEDFNPVLPDLATNFFIVAVDSRGHGRSALGPEKLSYQLLQQDIERLLEHLGIKKLNIMGFSDGGIVAYRLAAFSNLAIEKLITIGSRWHKDDLNTTKQLFLKITPASWKEKFPETYKAYQELNPEPDFDKFAKMVVAMWLDESETGYPDENVARFEGEVLIVRGDKDHLVSRKSVANLAGLLKNVMLLNIPFAGHVAFADQHDIFAIALKQFLKLAR